MFSITDSMLESVCSTPEVCVFRLEFIPSMLERTCEIASWVSPVPLLSDWPACSKETFEFFMLSIIPLRRCENVLKPLAKSDASFVKKSGYFFEKSPRAMASQPLAISLKLFDTRFERIASIKTMTTKIIASPAKTIKINFMYSPEKSVMGP